MRTKCLLKRGISLILAVAMAISVSACGSKNADSSSQTEEDKVSARVTIDGTKFMVGGKELWLNGANTPWHDWNEFVGNMDEDYWEKTFTQMEKDNVNCLRIWMNCNGESIVRLKSTGEIKNINDKHWEDLDKLFAMAEKHKIYIMATLLSFDHCKSEKWQALVNSNANCDAFAESYVKPFCERYGDNEYLFSIDIMNEPDWVHENEECGQLEWDNISYLFGKCASVIHENCDTLVTVGMGIIKYNSDKYDGNMISDAYLKELTGLDDSYVDFYSTHYYSWMSTSFGFPLNQSPESFGLDGTKPCVIGETSNDDEKQCGYSPSEKYKEAYDNGWNGVLVWMDPSEDDETGWYRYDLTQEATNAMAEYIPEKVHPLG